MDGFKEALYKHTGERLKRARLLKNMSQVELAKAAGYGDSTTIYKIEQGKQKIPASKLKRICDVLEIDHTYLTEGFEYTFRVNDNPVIIEEKKPDKRTQLINEATAMLMQADDKQLTQIVEIMKVMIGGSNDGDTDMER